MNFSDHQPCNNTVDNHRDKKCSKKIIWNFVNVTPIVYFLVVKTWQRRKKNRSRLSCVRNWCFQNIPVFLFMFNSFFMAIVMLLKFSKKLIYIYVYYDFYITLIPIPWKHRVKDFLFRFFKF